MGLFSQKRAAALHQRQHKKFREKDMGRVMGRQSRLQSLFSKQRILFRFFDDFKILLAMLKDYYKGNYREIPWHIISSVGATLLYVLIPFDAIPDFIPLLGFMDDAAVFSFCLNRIHAEVEKYKGWKMEKLRR